MSLARVLPGVNPRLSLNVGSPPPTVSRARVLPGANPRLSLNVHNGDNNPRATRVLPGVNPRLSLNAPIFASLDRGYSWCCRG